MLHEKIEVPADDTPRPSAWWPLAVAALLTLQIVLILAHAPWRDEYQALQIALQSPDLAALFANLRYEGHPPLWFLVLRGAGAVIPARLVLPVVQSAIAGTTLLLILLRAPLPRWQRLCIAISPFVLFEYGTVSRGASVGVMLLVMYFAVRTRWVRWTVIALLPMIDMQFGIFSIALLGLAWRDRCWSWTGATLWLVSGLAAAWSVRPAADVMPAAVLQSVPVGLGRLLPVFAALLVPVQTIDGQFEWGGTLPYPLWVVAGPVFLAFCWMQLRERRMSLAAFGFCLAALTAMSVFVYPLALRHVALLAILLILLMWREAERGSAPDGAFGLWLGVLGVCGVLTAAIGLVSPFDRTTDVARFIRAHGLEHEIWSSYPEPYAQGVSALLGTELLSLPRGCTQSYIRWDHPWAFPGPAAFDAAVGDAARRYGRFYLASNEPVGTIPGVAVTRIGSISPGYDGVEFTLYRIGAAPAARRPPPCPGRRLPLRLWARTKTG